MAEFLEPGGRMQENQEMQRKDQSVDNGQVEVQKLVTAIKKSVAARDFVTAESLRQELMGLDTIALTEIIAMAELIEAVQSESLDKDHLALWQNLYETLSTEEANCFYYGLQEKKVAAGTVIARQGRLSDRLLFVEEGKLAAVFRKSEKNNLVLQLGKGGFVGGDTFFEMSVCTSSLLAQSDVTLKILEKSALPAMMERCPGLYSKLESYSNEFGQYAEAYERKRQELSRFERLSVHGQVSASILNQAMKQTGKQFKASVADVSRGGACFFIKASRKEAARTLLARPLQMLFAIKGEKYPVEFVARGRVVKVKFQLETDYSVHVQFSKTLTQDKIEMLQVE